MKKLSLVLVCGIILWTPPAASGFDARNDLPTKHKASLFLQNKVIPGFGSEISPEDTLPKAEDYLEPVNAFVDSGLQSAVLEGNYPEFDIKIVKPQASLIARKMEDDDTSTGGGETVIGKQLANKKLILLDPVEQLLFLNSSSNVTTNGTILNEELDKADSTTKEGFNNFLKKLVMCKGKIIKCQKKNLLSCYLYCLLSNHEIGTLVKSNVKSLIKSLCGPIGTVFDTSVALVSKNLDNIKTIQNFVTFLQITPENFKRFTRLAVSSVPSILLKHSDVYGASYFKTLLNGLESDARAAASTIDITNELTNPGCPVVNIFNAAQHVVSILYKNPNVVDTFLPGIWLIPKVFPLINASTIKDLLKAFGGALSILVGLNCGLIQYSQTGSNSTCESSDQVVWEATEQELVLPESGVPVVCGAVPYIPARVLLDDIIPPVFSQDESTTTVTPVVVLTSGNDTGTPQVSVTAVVANMTKDTTWIDKISKTLDTDND